MLRELDTHSGPSPTKASLTWFRNRIAAIPGNAKWMLWTVNRLVREEVSVAGLMHTPLRLWSMEKCPVEVALRVSYSIGVEKARILVVDVLSDCRILGSSLITGLVGGRVCLTGWR